MTLRSAFASLLLLALAAPTLAQETVRGQSQPGVIRVVPAGVQPSTVLADSDPPQITITDPLVRGLKVIHSGERITIRGEAVDASGVAEVTLNGQPAMLLGGNAFQGEIRLPVGETQLIVRAVDRAGNAGIEQMTIERPMTDIVSGTYRALVVGIDTYQGSWRPLRNAARDARAVVDVLRSSYGFTDVDTLFNGDATRTNIIGALERMSERAGPNDHVIIYYSGHGHLEERLDRGYWVPSDATSMSTAGYIANSNVVDQVRGIRSKHTLLIADACFAGDIFRSGTALTTPETTQRFYTQALRTPSRRAITSGNLEPVMDGGRDGHSVFAYYFLKALRDNTNPFMADSEVFDSIKIPVTNNSNQTPRFDVIKNSGDEGGSFVFIRQDS